MDIYLILLISFPLLLLLSGVFSSTETAFFSLSNFELSGLEEEHPGRGRAVRKLLDQPDVLLNGILLGNLVVNISATAVATILLHHFGRQWGLSEGQAYLVDIVGMTLVLLIFAEISPKVYAVSHASQAILIPPPYEGASEVSLAPRGRDRCSQASEARQA